MTDNHRLPDVEEHLLPTIRLLMEIGMPDPVERMIKFHGERMRSSGVAEASRALDEAQSWLISARLHEGVHGKGSLLNKEHPTYVKVVVTKEAGRPVPEQFRYPIRPHGAGRSVSATASAS
ncbi:hypothetical protein EJ070_24890 [Mesorhizobium sp. M1E.F.Ca.ET.045.02.1.1]|uniref:hypothetical protein n=1 Tax=unclassified Mesorhizobium TaxID=325217 RepID=UPI000F74EE16|nr:MULTISPECIES: hypothetical protein [unclassified Mesorhizobium]AZO23593.1 hypothetical protein EJ070_24890 [Mesorhizobium sp. M1E.F.Ca.ET.045.02.1.1]RUW29471.1 hypothetical protein EOA38_22970 [Mesorhizobium sp. M1E.F.Ca.ET.041.01.1.1]